MTFSDRIQRATVWLFGAMGVVGYACGRGGLLVAGRFDWVGVLLLTTIGLSVCEMFRERRWSGPASALIQIAATCLILFLHPTTATVGIVAGCLLIGALLSYLDGQAKSSQQPMYGDEDEDPLQSIVILLKEPRYLDVSILQRLASEAWASEVAIDEFDDHDLEQLHQWPSGNAGPDWRGREADRDFRNAPPTLFGDESPYWCVYWPALLAIHNTPAPYFDDPEEVVEDLQDERVIHAIEQHGAWVSVDLISWLDDTEPSVEAVDRLIGQLLAELVDDENGLAVIDLMNNQVFPFDPETIVKLRDASPRDALAQPYYPPAISVSDEEMRQAVDEAKQRWPEFVSAFEQRNDEDQFNVKARFESSGSVEYIWLSVTAIEADMIYGVLGNHPIHQNRSYGDRVRVPLTDVNDWAHFNGKGDRLRGGFTIDVLTRRRDQDGGK